ncbi:hypothetical protein H2200_003797 [Cladophialophora chaetospira]|uniref:RRM domain-containing protein n=1 Tax=Cladophialophora chaetospira TaxID=386627 RepID=A0AA39CL23_9EURO|nr:hypothetical protein H2200_003797 [Cladophialophora chaetospira]
MSLPRGAVMHSSPNSVDETTNHGTPSTNITAFTPEAASSTKGRVVDSTGRPVLKLAPVKPKHANVIDESEDDIFLSAPSNKGAQLSPTAEVFTPRLQTTFMKNAGAQAGYAGPSQENLPPIRRPGVFKYFPNGVPADIAPQVEADVLFHRFGLLNINQVPFNNVARIYVHDITITEGVFSTDEEFSRSFLVTGVPIQFPPNAIPSHFAVEKFPSIRGVNATKLPSGLFIVSCSDIRDTRGAVGVAKSILPYATIMPCTGKTYAQELGKDRDLASDYEGQMIVRIHYNTVAIAPQVEAAPIIAEIKGLLAQCGELKAFHTIPATQHGQREIRVEFYDADSVYDAVKLIHKVVTKDGSVLDARPYQPDVRAPYVEDDEIEQISITGRSRVPFDDEYARLANAIVPIYNDDLHRGGRANQNMNHNAVDVARIQSGADVRTTIMLRNIPNRVDQAMLKNLLDTTSRGRYDFMYLRIDFANNCNVGYAFVNFIDAQSVIPFVLARAGKRWNCFNSDKVAEVSYATIQGRDCLVQKFRNSSVMLEHPDFRPKLFFAGNVANAGQEESFPGPDNHSKMRRSVENAEHVGLFIPWRNGIAPWYPKPYPGSPEFRRPRPLRRAGRVDPAESHRRGYYLPPARALAYYEEYEDVPVAPSPTRSRASVFEAPVLVDVRSPYDPFAGRAP